VVEDAEYAAFARRVMRSLGKRASGDPESLPLLAAVATDADAALTRAVVACHDGGYSYAEIAARLGCSRQAVFQRVSRYRGEQTDHGSSTA